MAMLAYMIAPLARGEPPRWGTMGLVAAAIFPGVGAAYTVWKHHRYESYNQLMTNLISGNEGAERESCKFRDIKAQLTCEFYLALFMVVASVMSIIFFAAVAPGLEACAHKTCGADVSWSSITLCGAILWVVAIRLGLRWSNKACVQAVAAQLRAADGDNNDMEMMPPSASTVDVEVEVEVTVESV